MKKVFASLLLLSGSIFAAELSGVLQDAYEPKKAVGGQPVRLRIFKGKVENSGAEAFTDAKGRYIFKGLNQDAAYSYIITVDHMGVPYFKGPFQFGEKTPALTAETISIYPVTIRLRDVAITESVYVELGRNDMLKVHHTFNIQNKGREAYTPMAPLSELITIPLPTGAFNVEFADSMQSLFEVDDKKPALVFRAPIYPTQGIGYPIKFTYTLPYSSKNLSFDFSSNAVKNAFNLFINDPRLKVVAKDLQRGPDLPYQGKMSQVYSGGPIAPSKTFFVEVKGLPRVEDNYRYGLWSGFGLVLALGLAFFLKKDRSKAMDREQLVEVALNSLVRIERDYAEKKCTESDYVYETARLRDYIFEIRRTRA